MQNMRKGTLGLLTLALAILTPNPVWAQNADEGLASEGISVHGHWIIEVYDGSHLVDRREFDNALAAGGDIFLADLLSGENSIGTWFIVVGDNICDLGDDGSPDLCTVVAAVSSPDLGGDSGQLRLEAFLTAELDGSITSVRTKGALCSPDTAPSGCITDQIISSPAFTEKSLASPIDVVAGQRVSVTVIISFTG